ncbi:D-alanyl-D-alanine carboxypeptidase [Gammaproteobacteria bacterium]|nr:D-alanyl-D-alanine carboxypeptidase [Gammaproteobacteria bacterium]
MKQHSRITPRLIRFRDAPRYLGMDRNRFNAEVRPYLVEIRIGKQGIAFDRLEMDAFAEQYISRNGRPAQRTGDILWDAKEHQGLGTAGESGTLKNRFSESRFTKALEQAISKKRN